MSTNIQRDQFRFLTAMDAEIIPYQIIPGLTPTGKAALLEALKLCDKLIHEEVMMELLPAVRNFQLTQSAANLLDVYRGCLDTVYEVLQLMNTLGLEFQVGWDEVHRSNMAKRTDGKILKNGYGKVLKPAGWTPPDLAKILADGYGSAEDAAGVNSV